MGSRNSQQTIAVQSARASGWLKWLPVGLAFVAYSTALSGGFVYDDTHVITNNPNLYGAEASLARAVTYVQSKAVTRPVTWVSYYWNGLVDGGPLGYHLVNIVLHAVGSYLSYQIGFLVSANATVALTTALLFAVHPIHTEAVANIVGRAEILAAVFGLSCVLLHSNAFTRSTIRWRIYFGSLLAFGFAALSKESALTMWALAPLCLALRPEGTDRRSIVLSMTGLSVVALLTILLRVAMIGSFGYPHTPSVLDNPLAQVTLGLRLRTAITVLWDYLVLMFIPWPLSPDYSFNQVPLIQEWMDPRFLLSGSAFVGLFVTAILVVRKAPAWSFAIFAFLVPLALTANILFPIGTIKGERLLYLPSLGWCLAAGLASMKLRSIAPSMIRISVFSLVAIFTVMTALRNLDWASNETLFLRAAETSPNSARVQFNVGIAFAKAGHPDLAAARFRRALEIMPVYHEPAFALANDLQRKGDESEALRLYDVTIQSNPDFADAYYNRAVLLRRRGELVRAASDLEKALSLSPHNVQYLVGKSILLADQGRVQEAREFCLRARNAGGSKIDCEALEESVGGGPADQ